MLCGKERSCSSSVTKQTWFVYRRDYVIQYTFQSVSPLFSASAATPVDRLGNHRFFC